MPGSAIHLPPHILLEQVKIYREWAYNYFSTRSDITYVNILATAVVTSFMLTLLKPSKKSISESIRDNYPVVFVASLGLFAFNLWATGMCNVFSNSFFRYIAMAKEIETHSLGAQYIADPNGVGVTEEFLATPNLDSIVTLGMTGNAWNLANATLAACTALAFHVATLVGEVRLRLGRKLVIPVAGITWIPYFVMLYYITVLAFANFSVGAILLFCTLMSFPLLIWATFRNQPPRTV